MKEIELLLSQNEDRPVTRLYGRNTLIDTGALVPVFSFTKEFLKKRFQGEVLLENQSFSGFGNHRVYGDVYSLSNFYIKELHFKTLEAFIPYEIDTNFPILICAPLLCHTEYTINPKMKKMIIKVPKNLTMNNDFHILSLENNNIQVQLNGVLMQNTSMPNILMQKKLVQQMENHIKMYELKNNIEFKIFHNLMKSALQNNKLEQGLKICKIAFPEWSINKLKNETKKLAQSLNLTTISKEKLQGISRL